MRSVCTLAAAWVAALASGAVEAAPPAELLDLAARVHYGYYHAEPKVIGAALDALERLADSPEVRYYRDFAALRRAQLGDAGRASRDAVKVCADRAVPASLEKRAAAEAWALVAACALAAGDATRREQAIARARERDADNPRIALVEAWALAHTAGDDAARRAAANAKLAAAVEAFDIWPQSIDDPDWGHAEALTALGAAALERGERRTARDLIERSLLLVPSYRAALDLRSALQGGRSGERAL